LAAGECGRGNGTGAGRVGESKACVDNWTVDGE